MSASQHEGRLYNQSSYLRRALLNQLRADGVDIGDALAAPGAGGWTADQPA